MISDEDLLAFGLFWFNRSKKFEYLFFEIGCAWELNNFIVDFLSIEVWEFKDVTEQLGKDVFIDTIVINFTEAVCALVRGKI